MKGYLRDDDEAPDGEHPTFPDDVQEQLPHWQREVCAQQRGDRCGCGGCGDVEDPSHDLYCGYGDQDGDRCDPSSSCNFFRYVCSGVICALIVGVQGPWWEACDSHPVKAHMGAAKESKNAQPSVSVYCQL